MIDEKFYFDKKLLAMTKKEIKSYRMKKPLCSQGAGYYIGNNLGLRQGPRLIRKILSLSFLITCFSTAGSN